MELKTKTSKFDTTIDPMTTIAKIKLDDCSDISYYANKFNKRCDAIERKIKRNIWINKTAHKVVKKYR